MRVYVSFVHGATFGYRLDKYGRLLNNATAASPLGSKQVTQHRGLLIRLNHPRRPSRLRDSPLHFPGSASRSDARNVAFCKVTRERVTRCESLAKSYEILSRGVVSHSPGRLQSSRAEGAESMREECAGVHVFNEEIAPAGGISGKNTGRHERHANCVRCRLFR